MMFTLEDFPLRLAQLRLKKGVSAREMSLAIGHNEGYIQNIESGKAFPSMEKLMYICEYLQITPSEFFDLDNEDPAGQRELTQDWRRLNPLQKIAVRTVIDGYLK